MGTDKKTTKTPAKEHADTAWQIWADDNSEEFKALEETAREMFQASEPEIQCISEAEDPEAKLTFQQKLFLDGYIVTMGSVARACKLAKCGKSTGFRWLQLEHFQRALNARMLEWELLLHWRMMHLAMAGNTTLMIFLAKFLNPFYDDAFRANIAKDEIAKSLFDRYPIPRPEFLPPEVPERFVEPVTSGDPAKTGNDPKV